MLFWRALNKLHLCFAHDRGGIGGHRRRLKCFQTTVFGVTEDDTSRSLSALVQWRKVWTIVHNNIDYSQIEYIYMYNLPNDNNSIDIGKE